MRPVILRDLLKQAKPYERLAVPFAPALRRAAWFSMTTILFASVVWDLLPRLKSVSDSSFFLLFGGWLASFISFVQELHPWLSRVNWLILILAGILMFLTHNYMQGEELLHWLTFIPVLAGAVNALILTTMLFVVGINILLWLLICALVLVLFWLVIRACIR